METMQIILNSLINGQISQMVEQIDAENLYDFWDDFHDYLSEIYIGDDIDKYFSQAVITYHRIKYR